MRLKWHVGCMRDRVLGEVWKVEGENVLCVVSGYPGVDNYTRHVRACGVRVNEEEETAAGRGRSERTRGKVAECQGCGKVLSYSTWTGTRRAAGCGTQRWT